MSQPKRNTLEAMPLVVMETILENCNYVDIQCLRKCCSLLRGLVDEIKPSPKVQSITWIAKYSLQVSMRLEFFDGQSIDIFYSKYAGGCTTMKNSEELRKCRRCFNPMIEKLMFEDFKILKSSLEHQTTPLEVLSLEFQKDSVFLLHHSVLLAMIKPPFIRTTSLLLKIDSSRHLDHILPLVSAETLEELTMEVTVDERNGRGLDSVAGLEHWNHIRRLKLFGFRIHDTRLLENISYSTSRMVRISPQQVARLKEAFLKSPTFQWCSLSLDDDTNRLESLRSIVPDIEDDPEETDWFFASPRPGQVFRVSHSRSRMTFSLFDVADLKEDDIVRD